MKLQHWLMLVFFNFCLLATTANALETVLSPAQTHSPRETLLGFINKTHQVATLIYGVEEQIRFQKGLFHTPAHLAQGKEAEVLLKQAIRTLDLSEIPQAHREHIGLERTLMLAEILKRIPLPDKNTIPNTAVTANGTKLQQWAIPDTEIIITRNTKHQYSDEYLFSSETVQRIPDFFAQIYQQPPLVQGKIAQRNFYNYYTSTPGKILPPKWYMYLPDWSKNSLYWDQTIWQWIALSLTLLCLFKFSRFLIFWHLLYDKNSQMHTLRDMVAPLLIIGSFSGGYYLIDQVFNITEKVFLIVSFLLSILIFIAASWFTYITINWLAEKIWQSQLLNQHSIDASFIRTLLRLVAIVSAATVIYFGAQTLGIPIAPLLAGFGALGLAVGIGAQEYFKNVVGGLTLYLDRPVHLGEYCECGTIAGVVEEIGLRSTRVRTLDNTLVIIPNAYFSNANITNFSRIPNRVLRMSFNLRRETNREQLLHIMAQIRSYLEKMPWIEKDPVVRLEKLGDSSVTIFIFATVLTQEVQSFWEYREMLLLQVMEIIEPELIKNT